jgi:hypothetical protein
VRFATDLFECVTRQGEPASLQFLLQPGLRVLERFGRGQIPQPCAE